MPSETMQLLSSLATHCTASDNRHKQSANHSRLSRGTDLLAHPVKARNSSRLGKLRLMPVPLKVPLNVCTLFGILSRSTPSPEEVIPEHPAKCSSRSSKLEGKPAAMADRPVSVSFTQPMKSKYNLRSPWQKCDLS